MWWSWSVDDARTLSAKYPALSSRDSLHVALQCRKVWSYDTGFDAVAAIQRIE